MRTGKIKLFLTVLLIALIFQSSNQQDTLGLQAKIAANQGGNTGVGDETQPLSSSLSQTSVNELLLPADNTDSKETVDLGRPARAKPQMKRTLIEPLADRLLVNSATTDLTSSSRRSPISIQAYTPFSPILIDGNGQFASWNQTWGWEGDGSKNRPYIIDNYRIADSLNPLISIQNTDVYFEIKDNLLNGINGNFPGIELINVSHGIIDNNTIHSCSNGIYMDSHYPIFVGKLISHNNTISRNEIYNSSNRGIEVYSSNQTMISSNYCYNSTSDGIYQAASNHSIIFNNTAYENGWAGIRIEPIFASNDICIKNTISNNTAFDNNETGILLIGASRSTVANNTVHHNALHGIWLEDFADDNVITHNAAYNNTGQNIRVWNSTNNEISYNTIHDSTGSGIFARFADWTTIFENTAFACGWDGFNNPYSYAAAITAANSTFMSIFDNHLYSNPDLGISIWYNDYTEVMRNSINDSLFLGIYVTYSNETAVYDNEVFASGNDGIFFNWSCYGSISSNIISNSAIGGIGLNWSDSIDIFNNTITNSFDPNNGNGIRLFHSNNTVISYNHITNSAASGLILGFSRSGTIEHNTVLDRIILWYAEDSTVFGNTVPYSDSHGIYLHNSGNSAITSNIITNSSQDGIYLDVSASSNVSQNNVRNSSGSGIWLEASIYCNVSHNTVAENAYDGIYLWTSDYCIISHNDIFSNGVNGIVLQNTGYCTISGNTVFDNGNGTGGLIRSVAGARSVLAGGGIGNGVYLDPSFHNVISNNDIYNNAVDGVSLYLCDNITISSNSIRNNGADGVFLEDSNANTIADNDILSNGKGNSSIIRLRGSKMTILAGGGIGNGVYLDPASDNKIANNTIAENNANGIFIHDSDYTNVQNNIIRDNRHYGINITEGSSDNSIQWNDFYGNNPGGSSQAFDDGLNNQFSGNFWSDHDNIDDNDDGIADAPYQIDGRASNADKSSKMMPNQPPEDFLAVPWVSYPNGGEMLSGIIIIRWSPAIDLLDHSVTYAAWYSPNNGDTWNWIGGGIPTNEYSWDTNLAADGDGYLVKIVATCSAGLTSEDTSDGPFMIKNAPDTSTDTRTEEETRSRVSPGWAFPVLLAGIIAMMLDSKLKRKSD